MDDQKLNKTLFLCGMMGSGKSTIGEILATKTGSPFKDLDSLIVEEAGMSIPKMFDQKGEGWFRRLEREILVRESQNFKGVMALGGGSLQNQQIVDHLKIYGWLIFLRVPKSVILSRVAGDQNRPKLSTWKESTEDPSNKISTLIKQRLPFYSQAHITIDTENKPPDVIAEKILKKLKLYDGSSGR